MTEDNIYNRALAAFLNNNRLEFEEIYAEEYKKTALDPRILFLEIKYVFFKDGYEAAKGRLELLSNARTSEETKKYVELSDIWLQSRTNDKQLALERIQRLLEWNRNDYHILSTYADLIEAQNPAKGIDAYNRAISINPNGYTAILYRAILLGDENSLNPEVLSEVDRAIGINPKIWSAYCYKAALLWDANKKQEALRNAEYATIIAPNNSTAWEIYGKFLSEESKNTESIEALKRAVLCSDYEGNNAEKLLADIYKNQGDINNYLVWSEKAYKNAVPEFVTHGDKNAEDLARLVTNHFETALVPAIRRIGDNLLDVWIGEFEWDKSTSIAVDNGESKFIHSGLHGCGYVAISNNNVWLATIEEVVRRFGPKNNVVKKIGLAFLGNYDFRKNETETRLFQIPLESITSSYVTGTKVIISTGNASIDIFLSKQEGNNDFVSAVNFLMVNRKALIDSNSSTTMSSNTDITDKFNQLNELYKLGLITEEEYSRKKTELLNRF